MSGRSLLDATGTLEISYSFMPPFPDFLILGAPKAGTTWLVRCLRRHPTVFLPVQEIHYWTKPDFTDRAHARYRSLFAEAAAGQVVGERSNSYLVSPEAAEAIARHMPNVKLVVSLRSPVDRAYSGYCMRLRTGGVNRDVERFLDPERSACPDILRNSMYYRSLQPYLARFPRSQIHFLFFDDIEHGGAAALTALCHFLGIEPLVQQMLVNEKVNPKEKSRLPSSLVRLLQSSGIARTLSRVLRTTLLGRKLSGTLRRQTSYPPLPAALRARMAEYFRDDVEQLSRLVERDLRHWVAVRPVDVPGADPARTSVS